MWRSAFGKGEIADSGTPQDSVGLRGTSWDSAGLQGLQMNAESRSPWRIWVEIDVLSNFWLAEVATHWIRTGESFEKTVVKHYVDELWK